MKEQHVRERMERELAHWQKQAAIAEKQVAYFSKTVERMRGSE